MPTVKTILDDYQRLGWSKGNDPMSQMLQLRRENPEALAELVAGALERGVKHGTFIDAALDLMDDASFRQVAAQALQMSHAGIWHETLARVLDAAALQLPEIFAGDWEHFLDMAFKEPHLYHEVEAWRALDAATIADWRRQLEELAARGEIDRKNAAAMIYHARLHQTDVPLEWRKAARRAFALLRCGQPDAVLYGWQWLFPEQSAESQAAKDDWLMSAGYALEQGALRALHSETPFHIDFGAKLRKAMLRDTPPWKKEIQNHHPTWQAHGTALMRGQFGGALSTSACCGSCHQPLHHLLTLPQPDAVGIACATPISFATCLSCLGWEGEGGPLFYCHDDAGLPAPHQSQQRETALTPQFVAAALEPAEIGLFVAPERWYRQDWGASNDRQNLSRIGGAPSWVQSAWYPECPDCNRRMDFVMQLDSCLPQVDGREWLWGSGGTNYTFWCANCRVSAHLWQCT